MLCRPNQWVYVAFLVVLGMTSGDGEASEIDRPAPKTGAATDADYSVTVHRVWLCDPLGRRVAVSRALVTAIGRLTVRPVSDLSIASNVTELPLAIQTERSRLPAVERRTYDKLRAELRQGGDPVGAVETVAMISNGVNMSAAHVEPVVRVIRTGAASPPESFFKGSTRPIELSRLDGRGSLDEDLAAAVAAVALLDDAERKTRLPQIISGYEAVLDKLPHTTATRQIRAEILYRLGRAIGYRELPNADPPLTPQEREKNAAHFDRTFQRLSTIVSPTNPDYVLLAVRYDRRHRRPSVALNRLLDSTGFGERYLYDKKRQDLCGEAGWQTLAGWLFAVNEQRYGVAPPLRSEPGCHCR